VPGYDAMLEIAAAAMAQTAGAGDTAGSVLVVGPGPGEELAPLLTALPTAQFTLLEPSGQMREACAARIAAAGASERCQLLERGLEAGEAPPGGPFNAVLCLNVLHLMPPEQQRPLLHSLLTATAAGGALLLGAYSESASDADFMGLMAVARTRLQLLGLNEALIEQLIASRNSLVFSLEQSLLETVLAEAGMEPPLLLLQSLFSRLWLCRRPG
jgi:tRNA (cmo5U34)-methyltransferase